MKYIRNQGFHKQESQTTTSHWATQQSIIPENCSTDTQLSINKLEEQCLYLRRTVHTEMCGKLFPRVSSTMLNNPHSTMDSLGPKESFPHDLRNDLHIPERISTWFQERFPRSWKDFHISGMLPTWQQEGFHFWHRVSYDSVPFPDTLKSTFPMLWSINFYEERDKQPQVFCKWRKCAKKNAEFWKEVKHDTDKKRLSTARVWCYIIITLWKTFPCSSNNTFADASGCRSSFFMSRKPLLLPSSFRNVLRAK